MESKSVLRLIKSTLFITLAVSAITPGKLTFEEQILDICIVLFVFGLVAFNKPVKKLVGKIPGIEDYVDELVCAVEECCQNDESKTESKELEEEVCDGKDEEELFDEHMEKVKEESV